MPGDVITSNSKCDCKPPLENAVKLWPAGNGASFKKNAGRVPVFVCCPNRVEHDATECEYEIVTSSIQRLETKDRFGVVETFVSMK